METRVSIDARALGAVADRDRARQTAGVTEAKAGDEEFVQRALLARPSVSIRARIVVAFLVVFLLMCAITASALVFVSLTRSKLQLMEKASGYLFEIEQARRFEKNFFLYGTNLPDALTSVRTGEMELERSSAEIEAVLGARRLTAMREGLADYAALLERLRAASLPGKGADAGAGELEATLRKAGARALADAEELLDHERLDLHAMLHSSSFAALGFLVLMFLIMAAVVAFLSRTLLAPLNRFVSYTGRIGGGDYSPIQPARRYRDEFSNLALAVNHMLYELKRREEALVQAGKMAGIGALTAGIAHELNNPLNNIGLTTEALIDGFEDYSGEDKLHMLDQIATQVERASATVRNLLDFTRREPPVVTAVEIAEIVRSTLRLVANELALAQIEAKVSLPEALPAIRGNPRNLQQVFVNLFLNAIQAMPGGGVLEVRVGREGDRFVRIDVRDDGVGIPPENLARIFEPFFTTKDPGQGTGLGLSVSYGIIEKHGGKITVDSQVGEGTTVSVFLPFGNGADQANHATESR
jgi:two-component system, NtrC family, sensor kinase